MLTLSADGSHGGERVFVPGQCLLGVAVGEQDVVDVDVIETCVATLQRRRQAQRLHLFLRTRHHCRSHQRRRALVVGRRNFGLVLLDRHFKVFALGEIDQQRTERRAAQTEDRAAQRAFANMHPDETLFLGVCHCIVVCLQGLERRYGVLRAVVAAIQRALCDEFGHGVQRFVGDFLQATIEHVKVGTLLRHRRPDLRAVQYQFARQVDVEVLPCIDLAKHVFQILVRADLGFGVAVHVVDAAFFHQLRQGRRDRVVFGLALHGHVPDRNELALRIDGDDAADGADERAAAVAVMLGALAENRVRTIRERLDVRLPQLVLGRLGIEQRPYLHEFELLGNCLLEREEVHFHSYIGNRNDKPRGKPQGLDDLLRGTAWTNYSSFHSLLSTAVSSAGAATEVSSATSVNGS